MNHDLLTAHLHSIGIPASEATATVLQEVLQVGMDRRQTHFLVGIDTALRQFEETQGDFHREQLADNDVFLSTLVAGLLIAAQTHHDAAIATTRHAVINAALGTVPEEPLRGAFLTFLPSLTDTHRDLLRFAEAPFDWIIRSGHDPATYGAFSANYYPSVKGYILNPYAGNSLRETAYAYALNDLCDTWLLIYEQMRVGDYARTSPQSPLFEVPLLTPAGAAFLRFIRPPAGVSAGSEAAQGD